MTSRPVKLYTIGFTKKSAEQFFGALMAAGVRRLIDIRLNNTSQLAGFAKREDLRYFLRAICQIDYLHRPELAPTQEILDRYKKGGGDWERYREDFLGLMTERRIEQRFPMEILDQSCLLCSEPTAEHCHRGLVAEYLLERRPRLEIVHL